MTVEEIMEKMREKMSEVLLPQNGLIDVQCACNNLVKAKLIDVEMVVRASKYSVQSKSVRGYALVNKCEETGSCTPQHLNELRGGKITFSPNDVPQELIELEENGRRCVGNRRIKVERIRICEPIDI